MHRIDGPGATVDNKFTEGDPVGGVQATVVTDDWLNDVQEEVMSVLSAGGVTPVKGTQDQLLQSLYKLLQVQKAVAFSAAGTATVLTLTPSPAISAYATNQRFTVKFPVNSGLNPTLNISAKGAKSVKQYDAAGAKVAAVFFADQVGDVVYDGTDFVLLDQLPTTTNSLVGIAGSAKNLRVSTTGTSSVVTVSADELEVESTANAYATLRAVAVAPSFATAGVDGLDVGAANSQTASTWYAVWVIWNGTTKAGLLSLSGTAPTLPAGYTHAARVDWVRTDATANKFPLKYIKSGKRSRYAPAAGANLSAAITAASGAATWPTAVSLSSFVPPTATSVLIRLASVGSTAPAYVGPNQVLSSAISYAGTTTTSGSSIIQAEFVLEQLSLYWQGQAAGSTLYIDGWGEDV